MEETQIPEVGSTVELTEAEKEAVVALREQYRMSKMRIAEHQLKIMQFQDSQAALRLELVKLEEQLNKTTGEILSVRGLDPKSASWSFDVGALTLKRVG